VVEQDSGAVRRRRPGAEGAEVEVDRWVLGADVTSGASSIAGRQLARSMATDPVGVVAEVPCA
jgi:hypothetical protein